MTAGNPRPYNRASEKTWAADVYQKAKVVVEQVLGNARSAVTGRAIKQAMQQGYPSLCDDSILDPDSKKKQPYWEHITDSAIQNLKNAGKIAKTDSGWVLATHKGAQIAIVQRPAQEKRPSAEKPVGGKLPDQPIKQQLLARLLNLTPPSFEKVAGRVLEAMGLCEVIVTGRVADGGIDGEATMPLLDIKVAFQAKRYAADNNIGIDPVQRLIGSVVSRKYDRGIFIITSSFTAGAKEEAAKPDSRIVLIDGQELVELMVRKGIGVRRVPVVNDELDDDFFAGLTASGT